MKKITLKEAHDLALKSYEKYEKSWREYFAREYSNPTEDL